MLSCTNDPFFFDKCPGSSGELFKGLTTISRNFKKTNRKFRVDRGFAAQMLSFPGSVMHVDGSLLNLGRGYMPSPGYRNGSHP